MAPVIVVTGGAGYIGSVVVHELCEAGYQVIVIDQQPLPASLRHRTSIFWYQGNYGDTALWRTITHEHRCHAVIHLAGLIEVGESIDDPLRYYVNNVQACIAMLEELRRARIATIIAASSSAVYGNPHTVPIPESHTRNPLSPYGRTKMMLEDILTDYHTAYGASVGILRFANVAGALPQHGLGELHSPETHLIPRLFQALDTQETFHLNGTNYDTPDGTCLRDFVHVYDVARLHILLLKLLLDSTTPELRTLNVGSGIGSSVRTVITAVQTISTQQLRIAERVRRPGDTSTIVVDIQQAQHTLGWTPVHSNLLTIISDAYQFHTQNGLRLSAFTRGESAS